VNHHALRAFRSGEHRAHYRRIKGEDNPQVSQAPVWPAHVQRLKILLELPGRDDNSVGAQDFGCGERTSYS
jgi:hypothetical protein